MWKRLVGIFCVICAAFTILYLRIGSIATDSFYVQAGQQQSDYTLELTINRGFIYDHELRPLVNQTQKHIAAILVTQENAEEVAEITDLTKQEIQERLQDGKPFLQEVHTAESEDDNIIIFSVYNRYEEEQTAAHLIGYLSDGTGVSGLEKSYQELLEKSKRTAKITYTLDAMGRAIPGTKPQVRYEQESTEGVVLTIDSRIQKICERAGKEIEKGAIVVMDCKTGKLRAVCSFPAYSTYSLSQAMNSEDAPMINRAFTPLSVGSTFKIAVAAAAIEQGIPTSLEYECTGAFQLGETVMHCHNREGHGVLTMEEAMVHSCNPYFINLGLQLEKDSLLRIAKDLSFGKSYELAPGLKTQTGILPDDLTDGQLGQPKLRTGRPSGNAGSACPDGQRNGQRRNYAYAVPGGRHGYRTGSVENGERHADWDSGCEADDGLPPAKLFDFLRGSGGAKRTVFPDDCGRKNRNGTDRCL